MFGQHELDDPEMAPVRDALDLILEGHDPYPAVVVDRAWERLAANRAVGLLIEQVTPGLLEPPVNVMRVSLHPEGLAPQIANLGEWRAHLLGRLRRQTALTGDPALATLLEEVSAYPGPDGPGHGEGSGLPWGHRGPAAAAHERRRAGPDQHDRDLRHRRRGHGQRAVDRVLLPRRRDDGLRPASLRTDGMTAENAGGGGTRLSLSGASHIPRDH